MTVVGALLVVALALQSLIELVTMADRPNDFEQPIGVPRLHEGPFDPTRAGIDPAKLPWVIDPVEAWPEPLRDAASRPCGLFTVLARRYPLWMPDQAPDCGAPTPGDDDLGLLLAMSPEGDLILERHVTWELAIEPLSGLVARRRSP